MQAPRPLTIALLWHSSNSDNLGVGALTVSQIAIVRAAAARAGVDVTFKVIGWKDPREPYIQDPAVETVGIRERDIYRPNGGLKDIIGHADMTLDIGAGDSFADIYGVRRAMSQILSKRIAILFGGPFILSPQTLGPFNRWWARRGALGVIRRSKAVYARDEKSIAFLKSLGITQGVSLASDVALRLPYDTPKPASADRVRVGLNVSGLLFNGGYDRANMFGLKVDFATAMRRLSTALLGDSGRAAASGLPVELHFVGHVLSAEQAVEDDYRVAEALAREFPGSVLAPRFETPSAAKSYIASLDFFAGARMHACIAAFSAGVPVSPLAYSRKFEGLFGALGYEETIDCRACTEPEIVDGVISGLKRRNELKVAIPASLARGLDRLKDYECFLETTLRAQIAI